MRQMPRMRDDPHWQKSIDHGGMVYIFVGLVPVAQLAKGLMQCFCRIQAGLAHTVMGRPENA